MGYDSTFSGALSPSKPIPAELVARINDMCDLRVATNGYLDCDGEVGDVIPDMRYMHGYDIDTDVLRVQRLLEQEGIVLNGEIYRKGEDDDDFERIEVVNGRVYTRIGKVVFGKRIPITLKNITKHYIRVMKKKGKEWCMSGWLGENRSFSSTDFPVVPPGLDNGLPSLKIPPMEAMSVSSRKDAKEIADKMTKRGKGKYRYEIVPREDRL